MPDIRLLEFVLLSCEFETWPSRQESQADEEASTRAAEEGEPDEALFEYPEGDFLELRPSSFAEADEYILLLAASIDEPAFPFRLKLQTGARFFVGPDEDGSRPTLAEAETTLVWLAYPYLRETISAISARSPLPPYILPALTKLPHPSVTEDG